MAPKTPAKATAKAAKAEPAPKAKTAAAKVVPAPTPKAAAAAEVDDKKRKAEENTAPNKEAKTDAPKTEKEDPADPGEKEKDAPADKRPALKETVAFLPADTTLNVVPTMGGKVLMSLSEGGMQYMIAGARANVGIKTGRYMYEVKIIEALNPAESAGAQRGRVPMPRQLVRLGFSTSESGLILGDAEEGIYFDAEGNYVTGNTKKGGVSQRFTRDQVMAVVLNLDPKSPNNNTVSLFKEGERICEPQKLPESLHGKTLFPHVSFRSVTVQMGFGPAPAKALPFNCRALQAAAQADVVVRADPAKDGKCEVLVPVAFPDEGTFAWLDGFLEKNPQYVEISDRKILEWAEASGVAKPKGNPSFKNSYDKPEFNFGLPGMDDASIRRVLYNILPHVPRNYVIMEVKSNLVKDERVELLKRFSAPHFKKVATVIMGEPNEEFKEKKLEKILKEKQEKADIEWKAKKAEVERKKQVALRQKQLADMRKKAEEQRKKVLEDAKKKREAEAAKKEKEKKKKEKEAAKKKKADEKAKKAAERQKKIDAGEEVPDEEEEPEEEEEASEEEPEEAKKEEEEVKEEVKEEETKDEDMKEEDAEEAAPQVELTEEEKKKVFSKDGSAGLTDLTSVILDQSFGQFTVPDKNEGFDEMRYEWDEAKESAEYLNKWVKDRKLNSRVEGLQPSDWWKETHAEWIKLFAGWQAKQKTYNNSPAKKAKDAAKKKKEEAAKKAEADGTTIEEEEDAEMEVDLFAVEDLNDMKDGEPLYAKFVFEDWALLQLRMEMYFLQYAFRKDVDDSDRPGVHDQHMGFYYTKYFRKTLNPKHFNVTSHKELCELVKDTVKLEENVLASVLAEETEAFDIFVKLTEESRRERQRRMDAGDETAKIKFSPLAVQQPQAAKATGAPSAKPVGATAAGATGAFSFKPATPLVAKPVYNRLAPGVRPVGPR